MLNALGKDPLTDSKGQTPLIILITTLEINLMITVTQMYNCPFPPVNQTIMAELLEAARKMTRYFKISYKHNKTHLSSTDSHHPSTNHYNTTYSDKHKCKFCNSNDEVNEIIGQTCASKNTISEPKHIKDPHDSDSPESNLNSISYSE